MADELRQPADDRMPDVTGRVALIERSVLAVLVIGLLVCVLAVVKPFTTAILFVAALATASAACICGSIFWPGIARNVPATTTRSCASRPLSMMRASFSLGPISTRR